MAEEDKTRAKRMRPGGALVLIVTCALTIAAMPAAAQSDGKIPGLDKPMFPPITGQQQAPRPGIDTQGEFLIRADEMLYDRENEIVTASGSVEISQGDRTLRADAISYNRRTEVVTASGNLVLMEPNGEVIFGEYAELTSGLRDGLIRQMKMLLTDNARLAAAGGQRTNGNRKEFAKGVFSPCDLCEADPNLAPIWQIRANRVIHDEEARDVIYRDAQVELFGVPVLYTPYLAHADPTVKRRSGLLPPTVAQSSTLGQVFGQPYYYVIDNTSDVTLEPRYQTRAGSMLLGEYRERFSAGTLRVAGSVADTYKFVNGNATKQQQTQGNVAIEGRFAIDETWRAAFDLVRYSDALYSRRFSLNSTYREQSRFNSPDDLISSAQVEGFMDRSYASGAVYGFQTKRADLNAATLPIVHPYGVYSYVGPLDDIGGGFRSESSVLSLSRRKLSAQTVSSLASNRLSTFSGYYLPMTTSWGGRFSFAGTVQADGYDVEGVNNPERTKPFTGTTGRVQPQMAAILNYPLINRFTQATWQVEPIIGFIASPRGGNPRDIPNEDSLGFEFDETSLFNLRRLPGSDRVSGGQRVDYALSSSIVWLSGTSVNAIIGQSYRAHTDTTFSATSGVRDNASDIVGRVAINPIPNASVFYRFRYDKDNFQRARDEVGVFAFYKKSSAQLSYIRFANNRENLTEPALNSLSLRTILNVSEFWSGFATQSFDLRAAKTLSGQIGVIYQDECCGLLLGVSRTLQSSQNLKDDTTFYFRLGLKYLGDLRG